MRKQDKQNKEGGYTLVIIAAVIVVFLGFTALSVDVGVLYSARASAQRAADAAALAGAFVFITRSDLTETTTPKQSDVIKENAIKTAATNKMMGAPVSIATTDVTVDTVNHRVTVQVNQNQPTLFARILGENSANIHATAVAEAATTANATGSLKPFFIPNTALSDLDPCNPAHTGACDVTPKELLIENVGGTLQVTDWAKAQIAGGGTLNQFLLKPKDPSLAMRPGDFFLIDMNGSNPGDIEATICGTFSATGACANTYSVLTGSHNGPVNHGTTCLVDCPNPDTYLGPGRYQRPDGTIGSTSRALIACPIWDTCTAQVLGQPFCPSAKFPGGTQVQLPIVGFALVFVEGLQRNNGTLICPTNGAGGDAVGRIVGLAACGDSSGGGGIDPGETGPFAVPLRLVRAP